MNLHTKTIDTSLPLEIAVAATAVSYLRVELTAVSPQGEHRIQASSLGEAVHFALAPFGGPGLIRLDCWMHGRPGGAVQVRAERVQAGRTLGDEVRNDRLDASGSARAVWIWPVADRLASDPPRTFRGPRSSGSSRTLRDSSPRRAPTETDEILERGSFSVTVPGTDAVRGPALDAEAGASALGESGEPRACAANADAEYRVWYGTNRRPVDPERPARGYGSERDEEIHYGTCRVFVPRSHKIGSLGSPFWKRLLKRTDDRLKLLGTEPTGASEHWQILRAAVARLGPGEDHAVLFLHGYRVSFQEAALRAAQIGFDLQLGAMGFFSWPSRGTLKGYAADEATIEASEAAIASYLQDFARESGAARVHVIAHSMGNRGLLRAINRIVSGAERRAGVSFGQFILAAADVDVGLFRDLSRAYRQVCQRSTLYVSARDRAVKTSLALHGAPRVGFTPPVTIVPGVDTVSVSNVDLTLLGHGYVAEARDVLQDMHRLLVHGDPPERRMGLRPAADERGERYWVIGA